jgi:AcrR family transcriptional regulator
VSRQADQRKREQLIEQATTILARRGVVDTSLRTLAADLGTTSRMLVHYFGTKDHLTEAVLAHVQRDLLSDDQPPSTVSALRDRLLREWKIMTDNEIASSGRILGQIMGAACSQDSPYAEYVDQLLDQLVSNLADRLIAVGVSPDVAEFRATITIAATQGLITRRAGADEPTKVDASYRRLLDSFVLAPTPSPVKQIPALFSESIEERHRQTRTR